MPLSVQKPGLDPDSTNPDLNHFGEKKIRDPENFPVVDLGNVSLVG